MEYEQLNITYNVLHILILGLESEYTADTKQLYNEQYMMHIKSQCQEFFFILFLKK